MIERGLNPQLAARSVLRPWAIMSVNISITPDANTPTFQPNYWRQVRSVFVAAP